MLPAPRGVAPELLFVVWTAASALLPVGVHGQAEQDVTTVDIAVFYTPHSKRRFGGVEGVKAVIDLRIAETNGILRKGDALVRLQLVAAEEVVYDEVEPVQDGARFRGTGDGHMDEVHAVRRQVAADVMALFNRSAGLAYAQSGAENAFFSGDGRPNGAICARVGARDRFAQTRPVFGLRGLPVYGFELRLLEQTGIRGRGAPVCTLAYDNGLGEPVS